MSSAANGISPLYIVVGGWISVAVGAWGCLREYKSRKDRLIGTGFFCLLVLGVLAPCVAILGSEP